MPDFFLLSGLFLGRVIDKPRRGYIDKKVIHYLYFFVIWTIINVAIGHPAGVMLYDEPFWRTMYMALTSWPFWQMWFIQMLPVFFIFTRLTRKVPVWLMLGIAVLFYAYPPFETQRYTIDEFWHRYVFFYIGFAGAPYFFKLADFAAGKIWLALIGLLVWIAGNAYLVEQGIAEAPFVGVLTGVAGAAAIISVGSMLAKFRLGEWIRYLGQNSLVFFLGFYWPLHVTGLFMVSNDLLTENRGWFCLVLTFSGLAGAALIHQLARFTPGLKYLYERPDWLITGSYESTVSQAAPASAFSYRDGKRITPP